MQIAPYDLRHTLYTLCRACRHWGATHTMHLYVYEDNPEALARLLMLLTILVDGAVPPDVRMQRMLEVLGNAFLRQDTASYLNAVAKQLETDVSDALGGQSSDHTIVKMLDTSLLTYSDQDALLAALTSSTKSAHFDMNNAWDSRCRLWHADRYDVRRNMVRRGMLPAMHKRAVRRIWV